VRRSPQHLLLGGLCGGLAFSVGVRASLPGLLVLGAGIAAGIVSVPATARLPFAVALLALLGWWWGSARLAALDHSVLAAHMGEAEDAVVIVTGPPRRGSFDVRAPAEVRRFGLLRIRESVLLELPVGRSPPASGAILEVLGMLRAPRGPANGFDERLWLRHRGVHVVLRADRWRITGARGGVGGFADRLRARLARTIAPGLSGERADVVKGVVLGDDQALSPALRQRFKAAGLYHLLAVSGQNVAFIAVGMLFLAWLAGLPRVVGELGALAGMLAYVLAVGPQASVIRAGIAGALGSIAWLTARQRDRWYVLLLGALVLLAWNPYVLLDPGFEFSFAAVAAIFAAHPPLRRVLDGYPLPGRLADALALSAVCGAVTAPISWLQFHAVQLLTVPANVMAAPVMGPLLALGLLSALLDPVTPSAAAALAWLNGWCAAYLSACARLIGGLPGAQIRSGRAALGLASGALLLCAYAWRRWLRPS
jgi:competence protein ComEC